MRCWQYEQGPQCGVEELQGSRRGPQPYKDTGDCLLSICAQGMVLENFERFQIKKFRVFLEVLLIRQLFFQFCTQAEATEMLSGDVL